MEYLPQHLFVMNMCQSLCMSVLSCIEVADSIKMVASFPGLPRFFCSSVCVQYNTRKRKSVKNGEGLVSFIRARPKNVGYES